MFTDINFSRSPSQVFNKTHRQLDNLEWIRISSLYKTQNVVLHSSNKNIYKVVAGEFGNKEFAALINLVGSSKSLLNRIFENSAFN